MNDLVLTAIILMLFLYMGWKEMHNQRERDKVINALISRNPLEFRDLELTDKVQPIEPPSPPDFVSESDLDDDEFMEQLKDK